MLRGRRTVRQRRWFGESPSHFVPPLVFVGTCLTMESPAMAPGSEDGRQTAEAAWVQMAADHHRRRHHLGPIRTRPGVVLREQLHSRQPFLQG